MKGADLRRLRERNDWSQSELATATKKDDTGGSSADDDDGAGGDDSPADDGPTGVGHWSERSLFSKVSS